MEEKKNPEINPKLQDSEEYQKMLEEGKILAAIGYIPFLFFVPLVGAPDNEFVKKHVRQSLLLLPFEVLALLIIAFPNFIVFLAEVLLIVCIGIGAVGALNALQKKEWQIPFLSKFLDKIKII
jgi:uncharacterized membrane protein